MTVSAPTTTPTVGATSTPRTMLTVLLPVIALIVITLAVAGNGDRILHGFGHNPPPTDELVVERVEFHEGRIDVRVVNPQSAPITPSVVTVDAAIVNAFTVRGGAREIAARESRTLSFPYRWIEDDPYVIGIVSSSGVSTQVEVPAAVPAESVSARGIGWGALIGILVGFVPVALGLVWLPALRRLSEAALAGFLAFTAGLLTFLAVGATAEAFDAQAGLIPAFGGAGVVVTGIVASMVALALVGRALRHGARAASTRAGASTALSGRTLALLVAVGIGLHNLGEGLAIGSSFANGKSSLAIALVIGFMIHNLSEGIGISAPIARSGQRLHPVQGLALAALAGLPAVVGIWLGRSIAGPLFTTLCFAIAAGAALQVVIEVARALRGESSSFGSTQVQGGFAAGIVVMWATGVLAG